MSQNSYSGGNSPVSAIGNSIGKLIGQGISGNSNVSIPASSGAYPAPFQGRDPTQDLEVDATAAPSDGNQPPIQPLPNNNPTPNTNPAVQGTSAPSGNSDLQLPQQNPAPQSSAMTSLLKPKFRGVLQGMEPQITQTALSNGLNPKFFGAVVAQETGWGTSNTLRKYNNPGGLMTGATPNNTQFQSFPTVQEGLNAVASHLKNNYINKGLTTVPQIGAKWAPTGNVANDPNHLNNTWVNNVSTIMQNL